MKYSQFSLFSIFSGSDTTFVVDFRLPFERFKTNFILYIYIKNPNILVVGQIFLRFNVIKGALESLKTV